MNHIIITYNPYWPELKIFINGRNLSTYSALAEYRNALFTEWCEIFFSEIVKEVNDTYALTFIGTDFEREIVENIAGINKYCTNFVYSEPVINHSIYERMAQLERIDDEADWTDLSVALWDNKQTLVEAMFEILDEMEVFQFVTSEEMLCEDCPLVRIKLEKVNHIKVFRNFNIGIVLSETYPDADLIHELKMLDRVCFVFIIGVSAEFIQKDDNVFIYSVDEDSIANYLMKIISGNGISNILSERAYQLQKRYENRNLIINRNEEAVLASLWQIEPIYKVKAPHTMYKGRKKTIEITEIPNMFTTEYYFKVDNPEVVDFTDMEMEAISKGKAMITVFRKGNPEPINEFSIDVYDETLVQEINVFPQTKYLAVGDQETLEVNIVPSDAVNIEEIYWSSSDEQIAQVDNGTIFGLNCGKCKVVANTDETRTEINVIVQPHIVDIICPNSYIELNSGEQIEWKYRIEPEDCYERDLLKVWCSDETIASYRGGYIIGKRPGTMSIVVYSPNNEIEKKCQVVVKKGKLFGLGRG